MSDLRDRLDALVARLNADLPGKPARVRPCPRCGRVVSTWPAGQPRAHKCPHGRACALLRGRRASPLVACRQCRAAVRPT